MIRRTALAILLLAALMGSAHAAQLAPVVAPPVVALVDAQGSEIIPSGTYDALFTVRADELYAAGAPGDYRLLDADGNAVFDRSLAMIHDVGDALVFRRDGLCGAMDGGGSVLVEPAYTQMVSAGAGRFLALDGDPLDEQPDEIILLEMGVAPRRTGIATASGLQAFADGRMPYRAPGGRWGALDADGSVAIAPTWRYISPFRDGLAVAENEFRRGVIDVSGDAVIDPRYTWLERGETLIAARTADGTIDVYAPDGGKLRFSLEGSWQAQVVGDALAMGNGQETRLYGANGVVIVRASAQAAFYPGLDGQVIVADGAWGEACQRLINPDGSDASGLYQRLMPLCGGRYAFLTMTGATYYSRDLGGLQTSWDYDSVRYGLLDGGGNELTKPVYREIRALENGLLLMVSDEAVSVADLDGNVLTAWPATAASDAAGG